MKHIFKDAIDLNIYANDDQEAKKFNIRSAVSVFVDGDSVPLKIAISNEKMEAYLNEKYRLSQPR